MNVAVRLHVLREELAWAEERLAFVSKNVTNIRRELADLEGGREGSEAAESEDEEE